MKGETRADLLFLDEVVLVEIMGRGLRDLDNRFMVAAERRPILTLVPFSEVELPVEGIFLERGSFDKFLELKREIQFGKSKF